ncbi:MAG: hypothetical protein GF350_10280 [Chitinivibrionales bacterium]|nr:hypothetical protein [Chitinivibrionales bacterium]
MNTETARQYLKSPSTQKIIAGLQTLAHAGTLADLQTMLALAKHDNPSVKNHAIESSCLIIRENLISHYHELDSAVREKLGTIMNTLSSTVIDKISEDLYSDDDERRLRAVQILGLLKKNPRVHHVLANLVKDRDVKIRATAVNLLGKIVGPDSENIVMSLLNDKDKRVRANTIEALESVGNKRLIPILMRFRKDTNNRIRGNVLKALYTLGRKDVGQDLLEMIKSKNNFMKASALWVVSQIKFYTEEILENAGYLLISDNEMVVSNAQKALQAIDHPRARGYLRYLGSENTLEKEKPLQGTQEKTSA